MPSEVKLTEKQRVYLELLFSEELELEDDAAMADAVGVKVATIKRWKSNRSFLDYMHRQIRERTESRMPRVWQGLLRKAEKGDVQATKLLFQLRGEMDEQQATVDKLPPARVEFVLQGAEKADEEAHDK